jgi:hypothetical protein
MVMPNFLFGAGAAFVMATTTVPPNNAAFQVSDFYGTITQDAAKIRLTRLIVDGQGFEHCAPGARIRFSVTVAALSQVTVLLNYTGLVSRNDTYNDVGSIFINGAFSTDFYGPATHTPGQPHPTGAVNVSLFLAAGTHLVEVILPYCAAVDFAGVTIPVDASVSAPSARVSKKIIFFGDSITHGFNSSKIRLHWPFLVAETEAAQMIDYGYGGRGCNGTDGTVAGNAGADIAFYLIGFNNFYPGGGSLTDFKTQHKLVQSNFRTRSAVNSKATAPFYACTPFDAPAAYGGGLYAANSPTLEQFRQAIRDGITEQADAYVTLVEGLSAGMPTGSSKFPDGIHPNDAASAEIAPVVSGVVA